MPQLTTQQPLYDTKIQSEVFIPNRIEAEKILNRQLTSYDDIQKAAHDLLALGANSVLLTGDYVEDNLFSQDYWTNGQESFWLANKRMPNKNNHSVEKTLSSAISTCLASGYSIKDAVVIAKMHVNRNLRTATRLFPDDWPEDQMDIPFLSSDVLKQLPPAFKACHLGLYPVVDSSDWVEKLLSLGVKTIQLRIKDLQGYPLEADIKRSILLAKQYNATLFINDYWELAIQLGASGIHLGQDDLPKADIAKIHDAGLYLGVSTSCYYDVAAALAVNPSYIACGPIYSTTSKIMSFNPQGIKQLQRWRRTLQYPLVAIGGINLERLPDILKTNVEGIALISAITKAADPDKVTKQLLARIP